MRQQDSYDIENNVYNVCKREPMGKSLAEYFNHNFVGKFYVTCWHFLLGDSDLGRKKILSIHVIVYEQVQLWNVL